MADLPQPLPDMPVPAPADAPHKEVETFECVICYEDGKGTGQITLGCSHAICLGCYTKETQRVAALHQQVKCPICRKAVRLTDEITPQEREEVARLVRQVNTDTWRVAEYNRQIAEQTRVRDEIQHLVVERNAELRRVAKDYGILDLAVAALAAGTNLPPAAGGDEPAPAAPAAAARVAPQMAGIVVHMPRAQIPVPGIPAANVVRAAGDDTARCPGCRTYVLHADLRYRHMPRVEVDRVVDRRLKRCGRCLEVQRRTAIIWHNNQ